MSRFWIDHPSRDDVHANAGNEAVVGFFLDVMRGDRVITSYDCFHPLFNRARPLIGCLDFLVSEAFFIGEALEDALVFLQDDAPTPRDMRGVQFPICA